MWSFLAILSLCAAGCGGEVGAGTEGAADSALTDTSGLSATYFKDESFGVVAAKRVDAQVSFDWGSGSPVTGAPADRFSVRWTGYIESPSTGTYAFSTTSDDGVRLWVDGRLLVDDWNTHGAVTRTGAYAMRAGQRYAIKLEYFEHLGKAQIRLAWTPPRSASQTIPQGALHTAAAAANSASLRFGARIKTSSGESSSNLRRDFASSKSQIGPLTVTRAFYGSLPANQSNRITPSGSVEISSYKARGAKTLASFVQSMEPQDMVVFYHEPEGPNDWANGPQFVAAFEAECQAAHRARPGVKFGMIAGAFQYGVHGRGYSGSFLPKDCVDFYAVDTYRDGSHETGFGSIVPLTEVAEFQRWYSLVKDLGKPLLVTEYGRGTVGSGEIATTPRKRAQVIPLDAAWLKSHGFLALTLWYSDFGPDGRAWRFTDPGSINAWNEAVKGQ